VQPPGTLAVRIALYVLPGMSQEPRAPAACLSESLDDSPGHLVGSDQGKRVSDPLGRFIHLDVRLPKGEFLREVPVDYVRA
jgi:hypothetical protein